MPAPSRAIARRRGREGNLIVTSFFLIIALMVTVGGLQAFLKEQMRQSFEIQKVSFAKRQAFYLAEMGINHVMYEANKATNVNASNPFPLTNSTGGSAQFDFKSNVAMVRQDSGGSALCTVTCLSPGQFQVDAQLTLTGVGTYSKALTFTTAKVGGHWVLTQYAPVP